MSEPRLILGDCLVELAGLPDASVDSVVTDPPYGINFMGKAWDGAAIQQAAEAKRRDTSNLMRLTGGADDPNRKMRERTASAFQNRAGEAGAYDFSVTGNRAFQAWVEQWARECLRVLKPGGFALVFGGTRTSHRLACGLEDAGFEIRDEILAWMFGSGFPKSLDVSKAIDARAGAEREVVGERVSAYGTETATGERMSRDGGGAGLWVGSEPKSVPLTGGSVTADAQEWDGWGTALKPAHEPIIVARKPLMGTVAANVLAHGTGGLNIDGCRIGFTSESDERESKDKNRHADFGSGARENNVYGEDLKTRAESGGNYNPPGRWPANIILVHHEGCQQVGVAQAESSGHFPSARPASAAHGGPVGHVGQDGLDERHMRGEQVEVWECVESCPVRILDEQSGMSKSSGGANGGKLGARVYGSFANETLGENAGGLGDVGGASRFFYCAKVSRAERNAGLEGFDAKMLRWSSGDQSPGTFQAEGTDKTARNHHPTVKPIALMRWLVRLVTPPNGTVLDPFLGSGTTGIASALEGFRFIGIEREADYMKIAEARIAFWREHGDDGLRICAERDAGAKVSKAREDAGQLNLLA